MVGLPSLKDLGLRHAHTAASGDTARQSLASCCCALWLDHDTLLTEVDQQGPTTASIHAEHGLGLVPRNIVRVGRPQGSIVRQELCLSSLGYCFSGRVLIHCT